MKKQVYILLGLFVLGIIIAFSVPEESVLSKIATFAYAIAFLILFRMLFSYRRELAAHLHQSAQKTPVVKHVIKASEIRVMNADFGFNKQGLITMGVVVLLTFAVAAAIVFFYQ